jgi:hypothetical protein
LAQNPDDRPSFKLILWQLKEIGFKLAHKIDSVKVGTFVKEVEEQEKRMGIEIDDFE